jgi:ABC-type dipeptide/oligopeptide/nickel transport system ATPase component
MIKPWIKSALELSAEEHKKLGIAPSRLREYPHQMSGGMRPRIMIGMGLILNPDLLIADEPTTALDVIVEAQFLDLLNVLRQQFDLTILLITHNLGIVAQLADRVTVMYAGMIAETGDVGTLFANPLHPYTQGLLASIPNIKLEQPKLVTMPGQTPDLCQSASRLPLSSALSKTPGNLFSRNAADFFPEWQPGGLLVVPGRLNYAMCNF